MLNLAAGVQVNIVGAGLSGLSAAVTLAEAGIGCNLISSQASERAQSVLAEGGINAALDTMGENDTTAEHFADTMKGGCYLESEQVIAGLTGTAPEIVRWLDRLGVPFNSENGRLIQRNFGGQAKKRTAYAKSSTGKILMSALIDEVRMFEAAGLVTRYPHHDLIDLDIRDGSLRSVIVRNTYSGETIRFSGITILCTGGLNGFFEGLTTGTTQNTGNAQSIAFARGAALGNLEFIQYHPTTVEITGKRMLISEAARGEGGRLYIMRGGRPWYFMEEKYPELGNLMPRDVVSREMTLVMNDNETEGSVYLDMRGLDDQVWKGKLSDLREEIIAYMHMDPAADPIPVTPGIHYFMGGLLVDSRHRTNIEGLLAAGETSCRYHGANRLGGNSMLGAIYGGRIAARTAAEHVKGYPDSGSQSRDALIEEWDGLQSNGIYVKDSDCQISCNESHRPDPVTKARLRDILCSGLGILRTEDSMMDALGVVRNLYSDRIRKHSDRTYEDNRIRVGEAMLMSALARKESRGAHTRLDYPETDENYRKITRAIIRDGGIVIDFVPADDVLEEIDPADNGRDGDYTNESAGGDEA